MATSCSLFPSLDTPGVLLQRLRQRTFGSIPCSIHFCQGFPNFDRPQALDLRLRSRHRRQSPREEKHLDCISQFTTDITHIPGTINQATNTLSRSVWSQHSQRPCGLPPLQQGTATGPFHCCSERRPGYNEYSGIRARELRSRGTPNLPNKLSLFQKTFSTTSI